MVDKITKQIWLICLWIACLSLVGCFHVPDEGWLPSKNKVSTWNIQKDEEIEQALDSFMYWINMISSERGEVKNDENNVITGSNDDIILTGSENYTWSGIVE